MTPHGEEAQIRSLIEDWAAALRAKDVSRVMSHQTADATQFTLAPPLISTAHESVPFYMDGSYRAAIDLKP